MMLMHLALILSTCHHAKLSLILTGINSFTLHIGLIFYQDITNLHIYTNVLNQI